MSETRRDVCKRSVFSALGLVVSSSLLKAAEAQTCGGTTDVYSPLLGTAMVNGVSVPVFIVPNNGNLLVLQDHRPAAIVRCQAIAEYRHHLLVRCVSIERACGVSCRRKQHYFGNVRRGNRELSILKRQHKPHR
jgi:hypothetical protein